MRSTSQAIHFLHLILFVSKHQGHFVQGFSLNIFTLKGIIDIILILPNLFQEKLNQKLQRQSFERLFLNLNTDNQINNFTYKKIENIGLFSIVFFISFTYALFHFECALKWFSESKSILWLCQFQKVNHKIYFIIIKISSYSNKFMAFYSSRLAYELELSRKIAVERELEYSRAFEIQKLAEAKQLQFKEIKEIQRLRQDQEFREYQLRKNAELAQAEENLLQERIYRQGKQRQYDAFVEAQKRSRIQRQEQIEIQKRILEQEQRKKSEALAFSRRVEMERQIKAKEDINRQNTFVLQEQRTQQKLEKQLREIDLQIGSIHDGRDDRKKQELLELQKLDETIFKLRQQLRGSKVRQLALEQELLHLSKLIV